MAGRGVAVTGGQRVWGSPNMRVGELVPRLSTDTMMEQGMSNKSSNGSRTRSLMLLKKF